MKNNTPEILKQIINDIQSFEPNHHKLYQTWEKYISSLREEVPQVSIEHNGETIYLNKISFGCQLCKSGTWDCTFITGACNLNCHFCISSLAQNNSLPFSSYGNDFDDIIMRYKIAGIKGISFSGGEPFLYFEKLIQSLTRLKKELPDNYYWVYTNGMILKEKHIAQLADNGLNEIRFNTAATDYNNKHVLDIINYAAKIIPNISVEIPVIKNDFHKLANVLETYSNIGVKYVNLHELIREKHSNSASLSNENFHNYVFNDGHQSDISKDSKSVVIDLMKIIIGKSMKLNVNFCSTVNKMRQINARRKNMIRFTQKSHEKLCDDLCYQCIFAYKNKNQFQFIHPDEYIENKEKYCHFEKIMLYRKVPLSIFAKEQYMDVRYIKNN